MTKCEKSQGLFMRPIEWS